MIVRERSPGAKLLFACLIGLALAIPLLMVFALVWDRQGQSQTAQASITQGWGGPQVVSGPVLVIPYKTTQTNTEEQNGQRVARTVEVERELFVAPVEHRATTQMQPEIRRKSIYASVLYDAAISGTARFALPADLPRYGIARESLEMNRAEVRFGVSDARGLRGGSKVVVAGTPVPLQPGKGLAASGNAGFFAFVTWDGTAPLDVAYNYGLRGSRSLALVPRGAHTRWQVRSTWPSPSFGGSFLPDTKSVAGSGFSADYAVTNLALGQAPVLSDDPGPPQLLGDEYATSPVAIGGGDRGPSAAMSVDLIEPVNLYAQVNRAVKYGFLFIGFTFLAFLMFDIVGGARVAAAEYLLTGAGLVLFFVLLLAFAEVIGFTPAYLLASAAIIGLLTAYSAAVLGTWARARFIGALLVGLYALLYVLLNLEAWSLLIGSLLLFAALAGVMFATRRIDWSAIGKPGTDPAPAA
ncbi:cell envelope integrity protein CreD [Novosphingobium tardum]|uniref:Cell envelope integrity protein CreD n=1 Tax=Novosphingobium tardum TaxID=1538021 RepID=A0ABV8RQC5_9SPHN